MKKGKGNRKEQQKRRRRRMQNAVWKPTKFELIDGNYSHFAVAFCNRYQAYLTLGLIETHKCDVNGCGRIRYLDHDK